MVRTIEKGFTRRNLKHCSVGHFRYFTIQLESKDWRTQKKWTKHTFNFLCLRPLSLSAKLNFNISITVYSEPSASGFQINFVSALSFFVVGTEYEATLDKLGFYYNKDKIILAKKQINNNKMKQNNTILFNTKRSISFIHDNFKDQK